jgi:hypothetical protein
VDDGGQIVGISATGTPDPLSFLGESIHPVVWQNVVVQDLGTLQQGTIAIPSDSSNLFGRFGESANSRRADESLPRLHTLFL